LRQRGNGGPAGPEGENLATARNISDDRKTPSPPPPPPARAPPPPPPPPPAPGSTSGILPKLPFCREFRLPRGTETAVKISAGSRFFGILWTNIRKSARAT